MWPARNACEDDARPWTPATRLLIYSHDSFGLGHLRRCRAIAHHLVERFKHLSVLILSGSPIIGSFDFRSRVDFVRVPGVIKLRNGEYTSLQPASRHRADAGDPRARSSTTPPRSSTRPVPGRQGAAGPARRGALDTLDDAQGARHAPACSACATSWTSRRACVDEWQRKKRLPGAGRALRRDLGLRPAADLRPADASSRAWRPLADKVTFTGYLRRTAARARRPTAGEHELPSEPYILVTAGRRRRRRGADRLGAPRLRERSRPAASGAAACSGRSCTLEQRLEFQERAARARQGLTRSPSRRGSSACFERAHRRGRDGRLQHVLRDPLVRQAGAAGAAHRAAAGAVPARRARRSSSGWCACCADDGVRAPRRMAEAPARAAGHGRCRPDDACPDADAGRARADRRALAAPWLAAPRAERLPRCACSRYAVSRLAAAASPSWSRAIRACRRPSSRRRSWRWSGAGWRSTIVSLRHPTDRARARAAPGRSGRRCAICRSISTRSRCGCCGALARRAPLAGASGGCCRLWLRDLRRDLHRQPRPPLRPGAGAGGRAAGRRRTGCTRTTCTRRPRSPATPPSCAACRWCISAHAKDVWTIPDWEKREKLARRALADRPAAAMNLDHLRALAPRRRARAGLSRPGCRALSRAATRAPGRDGSDPARPVRHRSASRARWRRRASTCCSRRWRALPRRAALALRAYRRRAAARGARRPRRSGSASPSGSPGAAPLPQERGAGGLSRAPTCSCWRAGSPRTATATACPT